MLRQSSRSIFIERKRRRQVKKLTAAAIKKLRELAVHVHPDMADHPVLPPLIERWGTAGTERHLRIRARSAAGPVAGAATY
jgi:hypothetical protein